MKQTTRTSRTAGLLEKMFRSLNRDFFPGEEVTEPIITIQSTPRAYGHVSVCNTWKRKGEDCKELNISADWLERPIENIAATMLHEMVHIYNMEHGVKDCSRGGAYHNKKFKEEAERRGLVIEYDAKIGWSVTSPSDRLLEYILEQGWTEIQMGRNPLFGLIGTAGGKDKDGGTDAGTEKPRKSSTRKYQCPCCGNSVRATKEIRILCMDCEEQMLEV